MKLILFHINEVAETPSNLLSAINNFILQLKKKVRLLQSCFKSVCDQILISYFFTEEQGNNDGFQRGVKFVFLFVKEFRVLLYHCRSSKFLQRTSSWRWFDQCKDYATKCLMEHTITRQIATRVEWSKIII